MEKEDLAGDYTTIKPNIPPITKKVSYIFDERMLLHKLHSRPHFECPERLIMIYSHLLRTGILNLCTRIPCKRAKDSLLLEIHSKNHIERIQETATDYKDFMNPIPLAPGVNTRLFSKDTYENCHTSTCAYLAAGAAVEGVTALLEGDLDACYCITRPAGHHAGGNFLGGFCYFNNSALAARQALGFGVRRVAILDWDIHHGNGTQDIFINDKNVLYISIHRFDNTLFYPHTGSELELGEGEGKGFNINIPLNTGEGPTGECSISDAEYKHIFKHLVLPILHQFQPEILIISCGFDGAKGDNLGKMGLTPYIYNYMTSKCYEVCRKVLVLLEGGYNLRQLSLCSEQLMLGLLGVQTNSAAGSDIQDIPMQTVIDMVDQLKARFHPYWNNIKL